MACRQKYGGMPRILCLMIACGRGESQGGQPVQRLAFSWR